MIESPRYELDEAIDRVAMKMVAIDDTDLLPGVIARLPERDATPWFLAMPLQLAAAAALVLAAFLYARPARETAPMPDLAARPVAAATSTAAPAPAPADQAVARRLTTPGSRLPAVSRDRPDHERSLAPVAAIDALELDGIAPSTLELDAPASLDPLVVTELVLGNKGDQ